MARKKQTRKTNARQAQSISKKDKPMGVKVVAVLYYIWAILWMLMGLLIALGASLIVEYISQVFPSLSALSYGLLITVGVLLGIVLIGLGVLEFFVARGLWRLKSWARIMAIVLSLLAIINAAYAMTSGFQAVQLVRLIVDGGIVLYLIFSKEARRVFK